MSSAFNNDQISKLNSLGIEIGLGTVGKRQSMGFSKKNNTWLYVIPVVGIGLAGFGFVVALAGNKKTKDYIDIKQTDGSLAVRITPTKTSGSIQQYLLASQQFLSSAIQTQNSGGNIQETIDLLNKSIGEASTAISDFPNDYRAWQQRANIYQSLVSQNETMSQQDSDFVKQAIADLSKAYKLESDSAEISRNLASLYAKTGDKDQTIYYLSEAIRIEPTKAQNFYDLARIQSQTGQIAGALETYKQLIWLVSDKNQKEVLIKEKNALEKILADNPQLEEEKKINILTPTEGVERQGQMIKADSGGEGVVIAAFEDKKNLEVEGLTESNAMSGRAILPSGESEVEISNENVDSDCQIYVSAIRGGKNEVLRVKSKSKNSFRVGLDMASNQEIEFKWWIIK